MPAESDLTNLLRDMCPRLQDGVFVFCPWRHDRPPEIPFLAAFREAEGWTVIVEETIANELGLPVDFRAAWITLTIHSDLQAVGFLAAVTQALANAGIPCNVVSAIHHDHLFVPFERGEESLAVLERLAREWRSAP